MKDLDYEIAVAAIKNHICKSPYVPKVSDIRHEYAEITTKQTLTEAEAWSMVREAIRNGYYGAEEEFAKLPAEVQEAVGRPSSLTEWSQMESGTVESVIQSYFRKAYSQVITRNKTQALLGEVGTPAGALALELAQKLKIQAKTNFFIEGQ